MSSSTPLKRKAADPASSAEAKKPKANASITSFFGQPKPKAVTAAVTTSTSGIAPNVEKQAMGGLDSTPSTTGVITIPATPAFTSTPGNATLISSTTRKPFDKSIWLSSLTPEQKELLSLEINTLDESWLPYLADEITSKEFLSLKRFLKQEIEERKEKVFPPLENVYSWSRHTPLPTVKAVILGQDPYHSPNQAHGLCFSVRAPTPAPPSLQNIYIALKRDYPTFTPPPNRGGLLTPWADRGVLLLNTCLTVRAHNANSHAGKGWERFTQKVIDTVAKERKNGVVFLAWGTPAQKRCTGISGTRHLVLKSVHPSPLSASRGFFECGHFKKTNEWLCERYGEDGVIDWDLNVAPEKAGV